MADPVMIVAWRTWLQRWWGILSSHLPNQIEPDANDTLRPLRLPWTFQHIKRMWSTTLTPKVQLYCRCGDFLNDVEVPSQAHHASNGSLELLVTVASSTDETSSRLMTVNIPAGECVAITLLASISHDGQIDGTCARQVVSTSWPNVPAQLVCQRLPVARVHSLEKGVALRWK